jgi:hypothetical protein
MPTTEEKLFDRIIECNTLKADKIELREKIQHAIDNIRKFKNDAGTTGAVGESYEEGRADAYIIVLGWIDELEKNS